MSVIGDLSSTQSDRFAWDGKCEESPRDLKHKVGRYFTVCVDSGLRLRSRPKPCPCAGGRRASTDRFDKSGPPEHYPSKPTGVRSQSPARQAGRELPTPEPSPCHAPSSQDRHTTRRVLR